MAPSTPIAGHLYPAMTSNIATAYKLLYVCTYVLRCPTGFSCQDYKKIPQVSKYYNLIIGPRGGDACFVSIVYKKLRRSPHAPEQAHRRAYTRLWAIILVAVVALYSAACYFLAPRPIFLRLKYWNAISAPRTLAPIASV